jgi:hypothetical protein
VKLNLISPYVYWLMHKITTRRYVGSRWANKCPPLEDIGKVYFSSGAFGKDSKYEKSFKKNPDDYIIKILMMGTEEEVRKEEDRHLDGYAVESNRYVNKRRIWPPAPMFGEDNPSKRPEVRRKLSEAGKRRPPPSAETKRKTSEALKGIKRGPCSTEHRRKIGEAMSGEKNPNYGKTFSAEHRRKLSEAMTPEKRRKMGEAKKGEKNPMKRPEVVKKALETKRRNREAKLRQI